MRHFQSALLIAVLLAVCQVVTAQEARRSAIDGKALADSKYLSQLWQVFFNVSWASMFDRHSIALFSPTLPFITWKTWKYIQ